EEYAIETHSSRAVLSSYLAEAWYTEGSASSMNSKTRETIVFFMEPPPTVYAIWINAEPISCSILSLCTKLLLLRHCCSLGDVLTLRHRRLQRPPRPLLLRLLRPKRSQKQR